MLESNLKTSILIYSNLKGNLYESFIDRACKTYSFFSLVFRCDLKCNQSVRAILDEISPNLIKVIHSRKLPANQIHSAHAAEIFYYNTTPRSIRPILKKVGSLFRWLMPEYPEDLCFYRADKSLAIVSNSHENMAYFFDKNFIEPFLDQLQWSEQDYTEQSFSNLLIK